MTILRDPFRRRASVWPARLLVVLALGSVLAAQAPAVASRTRAHVLALASERMEGRLTGSDGERRAAEYLSSELRRIAAKPLPGRADFLFPFEFTAGTKDGGSTITVKPAGQTTGRTFDSRRDMQALSFSDNGSIAGGAVVFAGYGIVVPEAQNFGYDSYATLDVKDKVVLVLRYFPEDADTKTKGILARYADLRYKAMAARQRGANWPTMRLIDLRPVLPTRAAIPRISAPPIVMVTRSR